MNRPSRLHRNWPGKCLLVALGAIGPSLSMAQPAAAGGPQEPPLCTDQKEIKGLKKGYQSLEEQGEGLKVKEITAVKELYLQPPPSSVNQYATKTQYAVKSRYCEGAAQLSNGKTDPMYWRMDYLVHGAGHWINYETCSLRHDLLDPKCRKMRDGK